MRKNTLTIMNNWLKIFSVTTNLTSIKIKKKKGKEELNFLQQVAIKGTSCTKDCAYRRLIKKISNNICFNKTVYKTNDLIFEILGK